MYSLVLLSALAVCVAGVPLNTTKPRVDGRITGGTETDITSHPYQVSVIVMGSFQCSGSIVSINWVVTSASDCFYGIIAIVRTILVRSGSSYSGTGGTLHSVKNIIVHESYDRDTKDYDVAVVQVAEPFTFSDSVQPIKLQCDPVPVGTDVVVTGWGSTEYGGQVTINLQQVTLQTISDSECTSIFSYRGGTTDRMFCAQDATGGRGACQYDQGGPVVASGRLVGIGSWGLQCGSPQLPDVYTKVAAVCDWIVDNAGLFKISGILTWIDTVPGLQTMPRS